MFDYKGYTEDELLDLCNDKNVITMPAKRYFAGELYSFGKHYREYGFYPKTLPLYTYSDHGIYVNSCIYPTDDTNKAIHSFTFSKKKLEAYKKYTNKKCSCIIAPYIWYRRRNKINPLPDAKGTIAFPAHSTPKIDALFNIEEYISRLKNLPEDMQPVCVCLHMHDIKSGQHKVFLEHGIPVYTAGNMFDLRCSERYYDILKHFKYSTSNHIGSYTFYCVEMGLPFSLEGKEAEYIDNSSSNLSDKFLDCRTPEYIQAETLFKGIHKKITKEQKDYVEEALGIHHSISRLKCSWILYSAYFQVTVKKLWAMLHTI